MKRILLPLLTISALALSSASAQTILEINFDSAPAGFTQTNAFTNGTPDPTKSYSVVNTAGVGGTNGGVATMDSTGLTGATFLDFQNQTYTNARVNTATSTNQADYTLTFDVRAVGLTGASAFGGAELFFEDGSIQRNFTGSFNITSSYTPVSFSLSELGGGSGTITDFASTLNTGTFSLRVAAPGALNDFALASGNQIIVDNISIQAVPEPATLVLVIGSLGFVMIAMRRHRRA